jgi:hypothetical protein
MSVYAEDHASALADVSEAGAAVTWSQTTPGTFDATTETWTTPVTTSCAGYAVEDEGDPQEYRDLELIAMNPATLLFTPSTFGDKPALGMTGTWAGATKVVKKIRPIQPDGNAIAMYLVVV